MEIKWKKVGELLKPERVTIKVFLIIGLISIILQYWIYNHSCLKLICGPIWLGVIYYIFWTTDLLNLLIIGLLSPNRIVLFIDRAFFLFLQACVWYLLACIIAHPIKKGLFNLEKFIEKRETTKEKELKAKIAHDIKRSEEAEKEKKKKN